MGKVNTIILNPDMTFEEKKVKTQSDNLKLEKHYTPSFSLGRSVFKEIGVSRIKPWKKARNLILLVDGSNKAFEMHDGKAKEIEPGYWTRKEKEKFVNKVIAKSKADQKIINTTHFIIIMVGIVFIIVLQFLMMRGLRIIA